MGQQSSCGPCSELISHGSPSQPINRAGNHKVDGQYALERQASRSVSREVDDFSQVLHRKGTKEWQKFTNASQTQAVIAPLQKEVSQKDSVLEQMRLESRERGCLIESLETDLFKLEEKIWVFKQNGHSHSQTNEHGDAAHMKAALQQRKEFIKKLQLQVDHNEVQLHAHEGANEETANGSKKSSCLKRRLLSEHQYGRVGIVPSLMHFKSFRRWASLESMAVDVADDGFGSDGSGSSSEYDWNEGIDLPSGPALGSRPSSKLRPSFKLEHIRDRDRKFSLTREREVNEAENPSCSLPGWLQCRVPTNKKAQASSVQKQSPETQAQEASSGQKESPPKIQAQEASSVQKSEVKKGEKNSSGSSGVSGKDEEKNKGGKKFSTGKEETERGVSDISDVKKNENKANETQQICNQLKSISATAEQKWQQLRGEKKGRNRSDSESGLSDISDASSGSQKAKVSFSVGKANTLPKPYKLCPVASKHPAPQQQSDEEALSDMSDASTRGQGGLIKPISNKNEEKSKALISVAAEQKWQLLCGKRQPSASEDEGGLSDVSDVSSDEQKVKIAAWQTAAKHKTVPMNYKLRPVRTDFAQESKVKKGAAAAEDKLKQLFGPPLSYHVTDDDGNFSEGDMSDISTRDEHGGKLSPVLARQRLDSPTLGTPKRQALPDDERAFSDISSDSSDRRERDKAKLMGSKKVYRIQPVPPVSPSVTTNHSKLKPEVKYCKQELDPTSRSSPFSPFE